MRPQDMGTTGLLRWILEGTSRRAKATRTQMAYKVIASRHGIERNRLEACCRFSAALRKAYGA